MYQDDRLQELLWMNRCVDTSSFYISKWRDQVFSYTTVYHASARGDVGLVDAT